MATNALIRSLRKLIVSGFLAVRAGLYESIGQVSGTVIDRRGIADRDNAVDIELRGTVNDSHENADADAGSDQNSKKAENQKGLKEGEKDTGGVFLFLGIDQIDLLFCCFFSIIHVFAKKSSCKIKMCISFSHYNKN